MSATFLDEFLAQREHMRQMREASDPALLLESMNNSLSLIARSLLGVSESDAELNALDNVDSSTEKMAEDTGQIVDLLRVLSRLALNQDKNLKSAKITHSPAQNFVGTHQDPSSQSGESKLDVLNKLLRSQAKSFLSPSSQTDAANSENKVVAYMKSKDKFGDTFAKTNYPKLQLDETTKLHTINAAILKTLLRMEKKLGMLNSNGAGGGLLEDLFGLGGESNFSYKRGKGFRGIRKMKAGFKRSGVGRWLRGKGFFSNGAKVASDMATPSKLGSVKSFFNGLAEKGSKAWQSRPSFLGGVKTPVQAQASWFERIKPKWVESLGEKSSTVLSTSADKARTAWTAAKATGGRFINAGADVARAGMGKLSSFGTAVREALPSVSKFGSGAFGTVKNVASKVLAPLAVGLSSYNGVMSEAEGKRVDSLSGIIPEGLKNMDLKNHPFQAALDILSAPTDMAMNAGRYAGNKFNEGYEKLSGQSMGADIYDLVNDKMPAMMKSFSGTVSGLPATISTAFSKSEFGKDFKSFMKDSGAYYTQFTNYANKSLEALTSWVNKKIGDVKQQANNVKEAANNAATAAKNAYDQKRKEGGSVLEATQAAASAAASGFSTGTEGGKRAFTYSLGNGVTQQKVGGDLNWRSNNIGNLQTSYEGDGRNDGLKKQFKSKEAALAHYQKKFNGVIDIDPRTGSLIFDSEQSGDVGRKKLLQGKAYGDKTVEQMVQKYAVSDYSGKADHAAYSAAIYKAAQGAGIDIRGKTMAQLNDKEMGVVLDAMRKQEGGRTGTTVYRDATGKVIDYDTAMKLAKGEIPSKPVAVAQQANAVKPGIDPKLAAKPAEVKPIDPAIKQRVDAGRQAAQYARSAPAPDNTPSSYNQMAQVSNSPVRANTPTFDDMPTAIHTNGLVLLNLGLGG